MNIVFPQKNKSTVLWNTHYVYLLNIFKYCKYNISFVNTDLVDRHCFSVIIDDKKVSVDFSDFMRVNDKTQSFQCCLKYHIDEDNLKKANNICPIPSISFYNWNQFFDLEKKIQYKCNNDIILNNQIPRAGALLRRKQVQKILIDKYKNNVDIKMTDNISYWEKINNCLAHVFVPGANPNMMDRGHLQYMAFGCCTISPHIPEIMSFNKKWEPNIDYIMIKNDFSDLIEKIEWCKFHREECIKIGQNAKKKFFETSTPEKICQWIEEVINSNHE